MSVIVPTYNEAENIEKTLRRLRDALAGLSHEIIVVDDDSPDGTWRIARRCSDGDPSVRVIRRLGDRGLSSAVLAGMAIADGEALAVIDADGQHDEAELPKMASSVLDDGADVCVGSRSDDSGGSYGEWTPGRRLASRAATALARLMLPSLRRTTDPLSGYFVLSRDAYERIGPEINPRGFKILLEFIGRGSDLAIAEVGYRFRPRRHGETKLSGSIAVNYLIAVLDLRFGRVVSPVFLMYCLVGLSGVAVSLAGYGAGQLAGLPQIKLNLTVLPQIAPSMVSDIPVHLSAVLGIQLSVISNFFANNYITFHDDRYRGIRLVWGFCRFETVSAVGVLVHVSTLQLLDRSGFLGVSEDPNIATVVNNTIGLTLAGLVNFLLNITITWNRSGHTRGLTYG